MPRRSRKAAKAGLILSANELRLSKPCVVRELRLLNPRHPQRGASAAETADAPASILAEIPTLPHLGPDFDCILHGHAQASGLPLSSHGWRQAVRLCSEKLGSAPPHFYVGLTSDVNARLDDHNAGRCLHTASRRTWQLHVVIEFTDEERAIHFERYLKSGSGRAFAKRHFEP